ncbi:MAG: FtsX-like permease family protein [Jiangellaceae bacterium]
MPSLRSDVRRVGALLAEAARAAASQRAWSVVTALIVAAVTGVILATTGQTAAAERQVLARIDEAGSRTIEVSDANNTGVIGTDIVPVIERMSGTDWVVGLGQASDGRNSAVGDGGEPVPFWPVYGELPTIVELPDRPVAVGEGVAGPVGASSLGALEGYGAVDLATGEQVPLVGLLEASDPLAFLEDGGLIIADVAEGTSIQRLVVVARTAGEASALSAAVVAAIGPSDPTDLRVTSPEALAELQAVVAGDLGQYGRELLLAVLGVGLLLVAGAVLGQVLLRRRDLGRRRALGATRSTIVGLIVAQTGLVATVGAVLGGAAGLGLAWRATGTLPGWAFVAGTAVLAVLCAILAAVPPAVVAAIRDPIRVLRTP